MQLRIVDGNEPEPHRQSGLMSYVINDRIAIDAGALGVLPLPCQKQIHTIFLSHSHADHIATLPLFIDNVYQPGPDCVKLYANAETIADLKQHIFNDHIWPDLTRLSQQSSPFIDFQVVESGQVIELDGLRVTVFGVDHVIPTVGFVVEDASGAVALVSDTGPCDEIWNCLASFEKLKAVFLEISFPNSMEWLAKIAKHLTPKQFLAETRKLQRQLDWYIIHVKPEFHKVITQEVDELQIANCHFALASQLYEF